MLKQKLKLLSIMLISLLIFSGCSNYLTFDPTALIKAHPQVQTFLQEYPNAELQLTHFTANESIALTDEMQENCGKTFTAKEMYRFYVDDPDSSLKIIGYLDVAAQNIECIKKYSNEQQTSNKKTDAAGNVLEEKEYKYEEKQESEYKYEEKNEYNNFEIKLDAYINQNQVNLIWKVNNPEEVEYFKVVRSENNEDPKYPEDGYVEVISPQKDQYEYKYEQYENAGIKVYYRITAVLKNGEKIHSEVFKFKTDPSENQYSEDPKIKLEGVYNENNEIVLEWHTNMNKEDLQYFKVVRSYENDDPKYPEDGYVEVVSPTGDHNYRIEIPEDELKVYYRISMVLKDYKDIIHSNVIKLKRPVEETPVEEEPDNNTNTTNTTTQTYSEKLLIEKLETNGTVHIKSDLSNPINLSLIEIVENNTILCEKQLDISLESLSTTLINSGCTNLTQGTDYEIKINSLTETYSEILSSN